MCIYVYLPSCNIKEKSYARAVPSSYLYMCVCLCVCVCSFLCLYKGHYFMKNFIIISYKKVQR